MEKLSGSKVASGLKWAFIEQAGVQIVSFLVFVLLARMLGPEAFGLLAISQAFLVIITQIIQQGFAQAIVQRETIEDEHLNAAFWANVVLSLLAMLGLYVFAAPLAAMFNEPQMTGVIRALSFILILSPVLSIQQAIFKREMDFKPLAIQSLAGICVGNIVAVSLALLGYGVWSLVFRELANLATCAVMVWHLSHWRPHCNISIRHLKELWTFAFNVIKGNFVLFVGLKADALVIGYALGASELGFYHIAVRLISVLNELISRTIEKVAMPAFARIQSDARQLKDAFRKGSAGVAALVVPIFVGLALTIHEIAPLMFGDKWDKSIPVMQVLLITGLIQSLVYLNIAMLLGTGQPQVRTRILSWDALLKLIAVVVSVQFGVLAVAWSTTLVSLVLYPVWVAAVRPKTGFSLFALIRHQMPVLFAVAGMTVAIYWLGNNPLFSDDESALNLLTQIVLGALIYLFILLVPFQSYRKLLSGLSVKKPAVAT